MFVFMFHLPCKYFVGTNHSIFMPDDLAGTNMFQLKPVRCIYIFDMRVEIPNIKQYLSKAVFKN